MPNTVSIPEVERILNNPRYSSRHNAERLVLHYGDPVTGRAWGDAVTGYIGRSTGSQPIPLVIPRSTSTGGEGILVGNIVKIEAARGKQVLWQHPTFQAAP